MREQTIEFRQAYPTASQFSRPVVDGRVAIVANRGLSQPSTARPRPTLQGGGSGLEDGLEIGPAVESAIRAHIQSAETEKELFSRMLDVMSFWLESLLLTEQLLEKRITTMSELVAQADRISKEVKPRFSFSSEPWKPDIALPRSWGQAELTLPSPAVLLRRSQDLFEDAEQLSILSDTAGEPEAHRLLTIRDDLGALVNRLKLQTSQTRAIGRLYTEGRISISEVAELLGVHIPDALHFLEEGGYARGEQPALGALHGLVEELEQLRSTGSRWWQTPELTERAVIATQRMERIDVRGKTR